MKHIMKLTTIALLSFLTTNTVFGHVDPTHKDNKKGKDNNYSIEELVLGFDEPIHKAYSTGDYLVLEIGEKKKADIFIQYSKSEKPIRITPNEDFDGNSLAIGDKIIYESHKNGNSNIYLFDIATKTNLLLAEGKFSNPSITADGKKLYLIETLGEKKNKHNEIVVLDMETTKLKLISDSPEDELSVEVSPNEKYLVTTVKGVGKNTKMEIYKLGKDYSMLTSGVKFRPKATKEVPENQGVTLERETDYEFSNIEFLNDSVLVYKKANNERVDVKYLIGFEKSFDSWETLRAKKLGSGFFMSPITISKDGDVAFVKELDSGIQRLEVKNVYDINKKGVFNFKEPLFDVLDLPLYFSKDGKNIIVYDESLKDSNFTIANPIYK